MELVKEAEKGIRFLVILLLTAMVLNFLFSLDPVSQAFKETTAIGSSLVMNALGIDARAEGNLIEFSGKKAEIIDLCTGALELAILIGAILASEDRSIRTRILGIAFSFAVLSLVNYIRVGLTLASAAWFGWEIADILHSILFRLFLVFTVLGIYGIWYLWVSEKM